MYGLLLYCYMAWPMMFALTIINSCWISYYITGLLLVLDHYASKYFFQPFTVSLHCNYTIALVTSSSFSSFMTSSEAMILSSVSSESTLSVPYVFANTSVIDLLGICCSISWLSSFESRMIFTAIILSNMLSLFIELSCNVNLHRHWWHIGLVSGVNPRLRIGSANHVSKNLCLTGVSRPTFTLKTCSNWSSLAVITDLSKVIPSKGCTPSNVIE